MFNRRNILKSLAITPFLINSVFAETDSGIPILSESAVKSIDISNKNRIIPAPLRKGSKIAIVAPASPSSIGEVGSLVKKMKSLGVDVEIGKSVKQRDKSMKYLSMSDTDRAEELMYYFTRKDINGIFCARGGYGVMRILDKLDYDLIRSNPKIVIGYSDITALLLAINIKSDLVCYHGPVASSEMNDFSMKYLLAELFENISFTDIEYKDPKMEIFSEGYAVGRLTGGNLTMVASSLGTPYEIDTKDSIIFLEETREHPYKIDRMLTQLKLSGKFNQAKGIILGNFDNLNTKSNFFPGGSFTTLQVLKDRLSDLNIPVMLGLPFGHMTNKFTLPLGILAKIDTASKSFAIIEQATC